MKKRNYYIYLLRDGCEIVYYGITRARQRHVLAHEHANKTWTNYSIIKGPLHRAHAEIEEKMMINLFKIKNEGKLPRYNI